MKNGDFIILYKKQKQGSGGIPEVSPKSAAAASSNSWLHDCPTCGKQIAAHLILRHQESCFQRATKETYGIAAAAEMVGGNGSVKKDPAQTCGYPLPRSAGSPKSGCDGMVCMVPWKQCDKHVSRNDGFCIKNEELCIKNEELCI